MIAKEFHKFFLAYLLCPVPFAMEISACAFIIFLLLGFPLWATLISVAPVALLIVVRAAKIAWPLLVAFWKYLDE